MFSFHSYCMLDVMMMRDDLKWKAIYTFYIAISSINAITNDTLYLKASI